MLYFPFKLLCFILNITIQAKGLGFMNQAHKDSNVDNNYKFAIYSLQLYAKVSMTWCLSLNTSSTFNLWIFPILKITKCTIFYNI